MDLINCLCLLVYLSASQVQIFWNVEDYPPTCPNFIYSCMKKTLTKKGYTDSVWLSAYVNDVNLTNIPAISGMTINFVPESEFLYLIPPLFSCFFYLYMSVI